MKYLFYGTTALFCLAMLAGGLGNLSSPDMAAQFVHLGFPGWFARLVGGWYVLGAVAIAAPGFTRLKEWAYAGFFFALSTAAVSHVAAGDGFGHSVPALVMLSVAVASWVSRPADRRLA